MALVYFDGFDTYGSPVQPTGTTYGGVAGGVPLTAAGWLGTSPASTTVLNILKIGTTYDPDGRNWLGYGTTTGSSIGVVPYGGRYRIFDGSTTNAMVFGYKWLSTTTTTNSVMLLGRFLAGTYVVDVHITATTSATTATVYCAPPATSDSTTANWFNRQVTQVSAANSIGTINAQCLNTANTLEVQVDQTTGLTSVWVNNTFIGTYTAVAAAGLAGNTTFGCMQATAKNSTITAGTGLFNTTDHYALTTSGAAPTARLGKVKVVTRVPTADVSTMLTRPSGAASNAAVVAQIPPSSTNFLTGINDGDTDMYSSTAFNFSNEAIVATAIVTSAFKTDPSGNDIAPVLNLTSQHEGTVVTLPAGSTYSTGMTIFATNPETGLRFTKAQLDASTFGVRVKDTSA